MPGYLFVISVKIL